MSNVSEMKQRHAGVYYAPEDVAGLARRIIVLAVDLVVVALGCVPIYGLEYEAVLPLAAANLCAFLWAWAYLGALKATRLSTVGYRLGDVRLVDLHGNDVGLWRCTYRFLFLFATLGNLVDLVWLSHDPSRQTLRDKLVGTYVIRRGALPLGSGPIVYPTYFAGGLSLVFPEVARPEAKSES